MFKIQDGRERFFQWDLNRKLIVEDDSITQVHFSNAIYTTSLVCEVIEGVVNIPNILLQDYSDIYVYGYDKDYTKYSAIFEVEKRSKPENYVYTETEILNYNVLLDRINQVDENIEESVAIYLEQNPPTVKLDGYATEEYVDNAIAAIEIPEVDLTNYYTKPEANAKFATKEEIPSTSGLATEEFVNSKVSGLATESYVDNAVAAVPQPDLSGYALKSEIPSTAGLATEQYVNEAVSNVNVDLTGYATETYVNEAVAGIEIPEVDLSGYALKSEIPSTAGLATETYVNDAVAAIEIPQPDLSGYQEKLTAGDNITIEGNVISATGGSGGGSGGSVAIDNKTIIQNEDGTISTALKAFEEQIPIVNETDVEITTGKDFFGNKISVANITFPDGFTFIKGEVYTIDFIRQGNTYTINITANSTSSLFVNNVGGINYIYSNGLIEFESSSYSGTISSIKIMNQKYKGFNYTKISLEALPYDNNTLIANTKGELIVNNDSITANKLIYSQKRTGINAKDIYITTTENPETNSYKIGYNNSHGLIDNSYGTCYIFGNQNTCNIGNSYSNYSYAFGGNNTVCSDGMALGRNLTVSSNYQTAIGYKNVEDSASSYALIAGIGQSENANGFTLDWTGNGAFAGQVTSTGSDYAEYFEWADGNPEAEDRVGYLVTLDGDKIRLATPDDEILGIISGTVAVLGDNYEWQWQGKYLTDDYGRVIYDMVDKYDDNEGEQVYLGTFPEPRINPDWDETATYIPRAKRKEWDAVGLLGKLYVRDDGTCKPNDYIKVGADGIATVSAEKTNMRVMSRKTDNIVKVYVR